MGYGLWRLSLGSVCLIALLAVASNAPASTRNYRGMVAAATFDPPQVLIDGVNLHGGEGGTDLGRPLHTWCVFIRDTSIVTAEEALLVGRPCVYYHEVVVQTLSAEHGVCEGRVETVSSTNLVLNVLLLPGKDGGEEGAVYQTVSIPLSAPASVKPGSMVRVLPGRRQTVEARRDVSDAVKFVDPAAASTAGQPGTARPSLGDVLGGDSGLEGFTLAEPEVVAQQAEARREQELCEVSRGNIFEGVVKCVGETELELWVFKGGKPEWLSVPRPSGRVYVDCSPVDAEVLLVPGRWIVYVQVSKRGGPGHETHVFGISDEEGRTQGIIKSIDGAQVTVTTLTAAGAKDVTIGLRDPVVRLDGKTSEVGTLKPGMPIVVSTEREQRVVEEGD